MVSVTLTVRIDLDLGESDIEELKTLLAEHAGDHLYAAGYGDSPDEADEPGVIERIEATVRAW